VVPRSFHELMLLLELEEKMVHKNPRCWCKCGTEARDFVPRNYGGYFYTKGKEQGLVRLKTVREEVAEHISPEIRVILKRYCTEFELRFGPSDTYKPPVHARDTEKKFWENVDITIGARRQPQIIIDNVIQSWMIFATGRGDKTVELYNGGKPIFIPSLTYEE